MTTTQLAATYAAAADACAKAPATPEKAELIAQRNQAASDYFRARYEQQRQGISRIQR
jgi:hypothetical protein